MAGGEGILTFAELKDGELTPVARQAVGAARRLADEKSWKVTSVLIGSGLSELADRLIKLGADKAIVCDSPEVADFIDESYCKIIVEAAKGENSAVVIGGATFVGKSLFGRLAAVMSSGLAADITDIEWDGDSILATRPAYGGKAIVKVSPVGPGPQMATLRPKAFDEPVADDGRTGEKVEISFDPEKHGARTKVVDKFVESGQEISLTDADIIVSGGRGQFQVSSRPGQCAGGRGRGVESHGGRRLDTVCAPGRPDRKDGQSEIVCGLRHLGRHPAPGRHAVLENHSSNKPRPGSAHIQGRYLRHSGRSFPGIAGAY
jgi:hypothetical protein